MIQTKTYDIKSCDDVELGIERKSLLNFFLTYDDSKSIEAIVCIIPGLGGDANYSYKEHLAQSIALNLNVAVLSVNYHCIANRSPSGAKTILDDIDKLIFRTSCEAIGFKLEKDFETKSEDTQYIDNIVNSLDLFIALGKVNGKFSSDFKLNLHFTLQPPNGDYQNFGLMSAIDVINAILHVKANPPFNYNDDRWGGVPCILVGSSHGGYIANLCAKISPWIIDGVVDNSSWNVTSKTTSDPLDVVWEIGYGREIDYTKFVGTQDTTNKNLILSYTCKTKWTSNSTSPYFCSKSRLDIRDVNYPKHLYIQSRSNKPIYIGYHSINDHIANYYDKSKFYENLKLFKFDSNLTLIKDQNQVDGKFIKNLNHGMDMSIKTLILKEVPTILDKLKTLKKPKKAKKISYETDEWIYHFKQNKDKLELTCQKLEPKFE